MYFVTTKDPPSQLQLTHVRAGKSVKRQWAQVPLPKALWALLKVCTTCRQSLTSLWKTQQVSRLLLRLCYSPVHQDPAYLTFISTSPCCFSNKKHLLSGCLTAQFTTICGICAGLHLLLKETSSKVPSLILSELRCMKRTHCLRFMVLTINTLTLKLFIYMTAGKSLTTSPKLVTS